MHDSWDALTATRGTDPGDPLGLNRYSYCEDSPIAAADPSGATMDANGDGKIGSEDSIAESYKHATPRLKAYWWSSLHEAMKAAHTRDAIIEKAREKALAKLAAAKPRAEARLRNKFAFSVTANAALGMAAPVLFGLGLGFAGGIAVAATIGVGLWWAWTDSREGGASASQVAIDLAGTAISVVAEATGASIIGRLLGDGSAAAAGAIVPLFDTPVVVADHYVN